MRWVNWFSNLNGKARRGKQSWFPSGSSIHLYRWKEICTTKNDGKMEEKTKTRFQWDLLTQSRTRWWWGGWEGEKEALRVLRIFWWSLFFPQSFQIRVFEEQKRARDSIKFDEARHVQRQVRTQFHEITASGRTENLQGNNVCVYDYTYGSFFESESTIHVQAIISSLSQVSSILLHHSFSRTSCVSCSNNPRMISFPKKKRGGWFPEMFSI